MRTGARVAVVGGGPAGAHCARRLAEHGFAVTLFEPRRAHEKACGGGIPARGLARFPFLRDPRLPGKLLHRCLLISPAGREAAVPLPEPLFVCSRAALHTFLLERAAIAGARLVAARVTGLERRGGAWELRVAGGPDASAATVGGEPCGPFEFLVAADGAAGACRRRLTGDRGGAGVSQGIGYFLNGLSEAVLTLKFFDRLHGYLWVFPRPDHSSAGICAPLGERPVAALRELMDRFLVERYGAAALAGAGTYAALIPAPAPAGPPVPIQGEGWAVAGDAGRFVDPLTREGIHYALLSGEILAETLRDGREEEYAPRWEAAAAGELRRAARCAVPFFEPRFLERMVALCGLSPAIARILADLIAGGQSYGTLRRRLILNAPAVALHCARRPWTAARRLSAARGN
jgi:flavin-dependent dehydrogenase